MVFSGEDIELIKIYLLEGLFRPMKLMTEFYKKKVEKKWFRSATEAAV